MTKQNYNNQIHKQARACAQKSMPDYPYFDWLSYKRQFHIVRYYPTLNMYLHYKYYCLSHELLPFGAESKDEETAHAALLEHLRARLA